MTPVGADQALLPEDFLKSITETQDKSGFVADRSQEMWDYRNRATFQGIPVEKEGQNLLVQEAGQLYSALQPEGTAIVWTGYISPSDQDKEYLKQYTQIKNKVVRNQACILQQNTQFCPSLNKFLVFVTYINLQLKLNPRYRHLKEDNNEKL